MQTAGFLTPEFGFFFFISQNMLCHLRISRFKTALAITLNFPNAGQTCVRSTECLSAAVNIFSGDTSKTAKALQRSIYTFNSLELFLGNYFCFT